MGQRYKWLREAIEPFNPVDEDVAEVSVLVHTLERVHRELVAMPCTCPVNAGPLSDWDVAPCARCRALGRVLNRHPNADFSDLVGHDRTGADNG